MEFPEKPVNEELNNGEGEFSLHTLDTLIKKIPAHYIHLARQGRFPEDGPPLVEQLQARAQEASHRLLEMNVPLDERFEILKAVSKQHAEIHHIVDYIEKNIDGSDVNLRQELGEFLKDTEEFVGKAFLHYEHAFDEEVAKNENGPPDKAVDQCIRALSFALDRIDTTQTHQKEFVRTMYDFLQRRFETLSPALLKINDGGDGDPHADVQIYNILSPIYDTLMSKNAPEELRDEFVSRFTDVFFAGSYLAARYLGKNFDAVTKHAEALHSRTNNNTSETKVSLNFPIMAALSASPCPDLLKPIFERCGIDYFERIQIWLENMQTTVDAEEQPTKSVLGWVSQYMSREMDTMQDIEREYPGGVANLEKEFGVTMLGRCSSHLWLEQLRQKDDRAMRYGVVVFPSVDHNGAFSEDRAIYDSVLATLQQTGWGGIRAIQPKHTKDLFRKLHALDKRYRGKENDGSNIQFLILNGHGSVNSIQFGKDDYKFDEEKGELIITANGRLDRAQLALLLKGKRQEDIEKMFADKLPVVVVSCSTGKKEAIGESVVQTIPGSTGVAPEANTGLKSLKANVSEDNSLTFDVEYGLGKDPGPARTITAPERKRTV